MPVKPSSLEEVLSIAERMQGGHADALALVDELEARVRALPPGRSELMSRPHFERASRWTLVASFEDPPDGIEAVPQNIELKRDMVIRGVESQLILAMPDPNVAPLIASFAKFYGFNNRGFGEASFRVDSMQGFQSEGRTEVMERLVRLTGDGCMTAPMDWELQMEQTIEVRFRNTLSEVLGAARVAQLGISVRWAVITFWAEDRKPGGK